MVAWVSDIELGRATVQVTTLGEEFLRGAEGEGGLLADATNDKGNITKEAEETAIPPHY